MNTIDLDTRLVTLTTEGAVATLTLNRPDARNALSLEMIAAMEAGLEKIESGLEGVAAPKAQGNGLVPALAAPPKLGGNRAFGRDHEVFAFVFGPA